MLQSNRKELFNHNKNIKQPVVIVFKKESVPPGKTKNSTSDLKKNESMMEVPYDLYGNLS